MRLTVAAHRNATLGLVLVFAFALGSVGLVLAQNPPAQQQQQQTPPAAQANGGMVETLELAPERFEASRQMFARAGLSSLIKQTQGDARQLIPTLEGQYDFIFIDAEKDDYEDFLDLTFARVRPGGQIRVVIVRFEDGGWAPYFCTDTSAEVRDVLEAAAARWAIEEHFHDVKEVWGAGQQQVRNVWSNIGCWHLNQWMYTLVELCCWDTDPSELIDRRARPWDNPGRRPSHADRRRSISREMLEEQFLAALPHAPDKRKFRTLFEALLALAI